MSEDVLPLIGTSVNDQRADLRFYADKPGLEEVQDEPYGAGRPLGRGLAQRKED